MNQRLIFILCAFVFLPFIFTAVACTEQNKETQIVIEDKLDIEIQMKLDDRPVYILDSQQNYVFDDINEGKHTISFHVPSTQWTGTISDFTAFSNKKIIFTLYVNEAGQTTIFQH